MPIGERNGMQTQILIVEDDHELNKGLCKALHTDGRQTVSCHSISEARQQMGCMVPNLLLLDINLPDGSGLDFLQEIKERFPQLPVVMLTANDTDSDIVEGLQKGADDYITKPFSLSVLRARIETQMRRAKAVAASKVQQEVQQKMRQEMQPEESLSPDMYHIGDYVFDFRRMIFTVAGQAVELSKTEQKALRILVENRGIKVDRERMIDLIWTDGSEFVEDNALSVTVKRLRDKLNAGQYIKTVYGVGYTWEKTENQ